MIILKATVYVPADTVEETKNKLEDGKAKGFLRGILLTGVKEKSLTFCIGLVPGKNRGEVLSAYLDMLSIPHMGDFSWTHIGIRELGQRIAKGAKEGLCPDVKDSFILLHIPVFSDPQIFRFMTELPDIKEMKEDDFMKECIVARSSTLLMECKRIFNGKEKEFKGHPVFYCATAEYKETCMKYVDLLRNALYLSGRLYSPRACFIKPRQCPIPEKELEGIYEAQKGATVVVDVSPFEDHDIFNDMIVQQTDRIFDMARLYRNEVLTVFIASGVIPEFTGALRDDLGGFPIVSIFEESMDAEEAQEYLWNMGENLGIKDKHFDISLPETEEGYSEGFAKRLFEKWENGYLCNDVYPEYAWLAPRPDENEEWPDDGNDCFDETDPMKELESLIGLDNVKSIIHRVLDYVKMRDLCMEFKIPTEPPHLHMVFSGNPGTAKTTVARLVARILHRAGVLENDEIVECGRSDLVGKYVGWTANLVKDKFEEADGSVLFIDEAYALVEDKDGSYGDEAINTIVQEMENRRDRTVVIFAGYREPMEEFLNRNPGLRSRISYAIDFPDYSKEELLEILDLTVESKYRTLSPEARKKAGTILAAVRTERDFGNGRYVRNMVEQAMLRQASRIVRIPREELTKEILMTLTEDDFEAAPQTEKKKTYSIGFAA